MPTLPTVVTEYLTAVKTALNTGPDLGSNLRGAAQNYLRAQDSATVLELLQDALSQSTNLTATGGTTTTVTDGAGTFVPGTQVGNTVVFAGNVTSALAGVTAVVRSNDDRSLTFEAVLGAAPQSGDTYTIVGSLVQDAINTLRQGKGLADAPPGSVYGNNRVAVGAIVSFLEKVGVVQATGTLTLAGNIADGETVTIGTKVYTFQDTLTDVDGNVHIGATASDTLDNFIAGINLGAGAGTDYATSMTLNADVSAATGAGDTMDVTAKAAVGPAGNTVATTTDAAQGSWGAATLTGGANGAATERNIGRPGLVTAAGSTTTQVVLATAGVPFRIDQLKDTRVTVAGESRFVDTNDETTVTLRGALSSAPSAGVAVSITVPVDNFGGGSSPKIVTHPGPQPGENIYLAELIDQLQTAVVAFTLPT